MKKLLVIMIVVTMILGFSGCQKEEAFEFTRENFPVLDGSTSMVPLAKAIASVLLGESKEEVADLISFHKTTQSYYNLVDGTSTVILAADPDDEAFTYMARQNFEYEMEQIAKEGLVFMVNENNPVDNLTIQQVIDIYSGKITNWQEVGGNDEEIIPLQRNTTSGSGVIMSKIMGDIEMTEAPSEYLIGTMNALIEVLKSYDDSGNAIGYTVYYYANDMEMADGLKIIQIEGVQANAETIRSGEYPFAIGGYYCTISAKEEENSPARILYQWLVSQQGQKLLESEGYISLYQE